MTPGMAFIPRGPKGSYDSECIYAMSGPAIAQGNDLLIYYGGSETPHLGWKRHCLHSLARLPLDHFAGYEVLEKGKAAVLESGASTVGDEPLRVSADAEGGSVRVQALDGVKVLAESEPITANVTDAPVRWQHGDFAALKGKAVRFRFELNDAKLYALGGVTLLDTKLPRR